MIDPPSILGQWLEGQRWYGNKGSVPNLEHIGSWFLLSPDPDVEIATFLLIDHAEGKPALYQVPVTIRSAPQAELEFALIGQTDATTSDGHAPRYLYDAPHDQAYTSALLELILSNGTALGDRATAIGQPYSAANASALRSRVLTGEQSNTSIIYESTDGSTEPIICKLFRALHDGENPDVELQTALAGAGATSVPRSIGSIVGEWNDSGRDSGRARGHLAFAQEFLPGVEDAWRVALRVAASGEDFTTAAFDLGVTTAQTHATLAEVLPTSTSTPADIAEVLAQMRGRLDTAVAEVPELAGYREDVERVFELARFAVWPPRQRIHGDFHLGQVLTAPGRGWKLVDFEGEPLRPMHERTRLDSPLRDVAGMLRSFDYVAGCLVLEQQIDARDWASSARRAFLDGYSSASGRDVRADAAVLDAFEIDKALYEAVYEARNRPGWLSIPVTAIGRLTEAAIVD